MPLIHKKTPAAFKQNIKTEMAHGKPQKQALAIAYSEKEKAEHKKHLANGGKVAECPMCYAEGGKVELDEHEKEEMPKANGTLEGYHEKGKNTPVGQMQRHQDLKVYKKMHGPKIQGLDEGGKAGDPKQGHWYDSVLGNEQASASEPKPKSLPTGSAAGSDVGAKKLGEGFSKLNDWAEGGEVEDREGDGEIHEMLGKEMMDAIHTKDHKRIMDGIEACVLSCMNKHKE